MFFTSNTDQILNANLFCLQLLVSFYINSLSKTLQKICLPFDDTTKDFRQTIDFIKIQDFSIKYYAFSLNDSKFEDKSS